MSTWSHRLVVVTARKKVALTLLTFLFQLNILLNTIGLVGGESLEWALQRNIAHLRQSSGCSIPIDFDRALYRHLAYSLNERNIQIAHIEVNFEYYTINKRYHLFLMPDSRGLTTFRDRHRFQRNSLVPFESYYEHITTRASRPIDDVCRGGLDRDLSVQYSIFTSMMDAAVTGMLPYQSFVHASVCFTKNVNPNLRTSVDDVLQLPNDRFQCCLANQDIESCLRANHTIQDLPQVQAHPWFLYVIFAIVYGYILPLVIAWVLCDVNCLEDGRTLTYVLNPRTVYFGYGQLGFPPFIKKLTFILLGSSGYALVAVQLLTSRSPADQLWFILCFLLLSIILMCSAKRLVQAEALRPAESYLLGCIRLHKSPTGLDHLHHHHHHHHLNHHHNLDNKAILGPVSSDTLMVDDKVDALIQQQDQLQNLHPDITVYPSISDSPRLLFMSRYWARYVKLVRRLCNRYKLFLVLSPVLAPLLLLLHIANTIPLVQLIVFICLQIKALVSLHASGGGVSTVVLVIGCTILFIGYVALLVYIPCVLLLCLYFTTMTMLHSVHLLMIGLAVAIVIYQIGIFICQECCKFCYMTECVVKLNLVYLRYEGAQHRGPCCEQLIRSVPLNPNHVQINSIFYDSLVKTFFPLSHSIKMLTFRCGIFILVCSFIFAVLVQCGTNFYITQSISLNLLIAVVVPKLVFSIWPCCSQGSTGLGHCNLPSPSVEQAIYILIDDWYRKNCRNSPKPSSTIIKIGPGIDSFVSKMTTTTTTPPLGPRDLVISNNMMDQQITPYSENNYNSYYYGTGKFSGHSASPLAYPDNTMAESGRYTLSTRGGGGGGGATLPHSHHHHHHQHNHNLQPNLQHSMLCPHLTPPTAAPVMSNSMIKHAVFAAKQQRTSSHCDTASEVDSILYCNDIVSKHPSERTPVICTACHAMSQQQRLYSAKAVEEALQQCHYKVSPNASSSSSGGSSDNQSTEDSQLTGPGSPSSYDNEVVLSQRTTVRTQSVPTDESTL